MNLTIDQGNTTLKAALFEGDKLLKIFRNLSKAAIEQLIDENNPSAIIHSSVKNQTLLKFFQNRSPFIIELDNKTRLPFKNLYSTPASLGPDRLAAAAGAFFLYSGKNNLIIDAGTCITADIMTSSGEYLGGVISPGIEMRFKALNIFTAKLPLLDGRGLIDLPGKNTEESIKGGVLNGVRGEIQYLIDDYAEKFPQLNVIVCGGDTAFFETNLKGAIFGVPELIHIGLNFILNYNVFKR